MTTVSSTIIARTASRAVVPLIIGASLYFFVRGHDAPGGGFIAGLIAGAAVVLRHLTGSVRAGRGIRFSTLLAGGLACAVATGIAGVILGGSFLGPGIAYLDIPLVGQLKLTASMVFDLGVYLVVVAVVVAIVEQLGEERV